jgi:Tol biopolymer transport system component
MSRMCTVVAVEQEIGTSTRRASHAFVSAPVAIIGIVAVTASQVFAQAAPPLQFNGPVSVGPLSVELRMTNRDASVDTSTITPSLTTSPGDIVFVSTRDGNPEIYSVKADGTNLTRLTNNPANDDAPVWSPDGKRIAFATDRDGSWEIYVMNADGTNVVRRTFSASYSGDPCWSPDGNRIVYSTLSNGSLNIWTVSPDSGSPALLLEMPGYDAHPALSPDGSRLAVTSDWYAYDFVYDVFIANADGTGWTGLTGDIFDHVDYVRPSWSPDSAKLAVAITQTTGVDQYITQLGVMNADGSGLTPLISAATWAKSSWSPDGTTIAFTSESSGVLNISWVSATDGSKSGTIVTNGYSPDWGPALPKPALPKLVAAFEYACNGMTCGFDGSASSGGDGAITTWAWDFGDGSTGAGVTTSHDYAAGGSYPVRLTVTDTNGSTSTQTENVIVQPPGSPASFTLSLNQNVFAPGETMTVAAKLAPGLAPSAVDAYVVVQLPTGQLLSLQLPGGIVPGIIPIARGIVPIAYQGTLISYTFNGSEPHGTYTWYSVLTQPGTLNFVSPLQRTTFTVP